MTGLTVRDAQLEVWHQNADRSNYGDPEDPPDAVVDPGDLQSITVKSRADELLDDAQLDLHHPTDSELRLGDRVRYSATVATRGGEPYGEGTYGETTYGGGVVDVEWVGRVEPTRTTRDDISHGTQATDATDWVGGVLAERSITGAYVDEDIGAIIRDIVRTKASEVDASAVPDLGETTDAFFQNRDCWDAIVGLAATADVLITAESNRLNVTPIGDLTPSFQLEPNDYGLPWSTDVDDDVSNVVRVDSGVNRQLEAAAETVDGWERVTDSNRLTYRLRARKSQIHSLELRVRSDDTSEDGLRVRLQADEGGGPIAINDDDSDIISSTADADDLPGEGWKTWFLSDHTLPERSPWLIVETDGPDGHDVALSDVTAGDPTFRSYYPHRLNFEATHSASIEEYGSREIRIERDNLETLAATRDAARSELRRRAWPTKTIQFPARSGRAHTLEPGDVIRVDRPDERAVGDFIVVERAQVFDASTVAVETEITATWRKGVLAPEI